MLRGDTANLRKSAQTSITVNPDNHKVTFGRNIAALAPSFPHTSSAQIKKFNIRQSWRSESEASSLKFIIFEVSAVNLLALMIAR